jgi:hypothetical protein
VAEFLGLAGSKFKVRVSSICRGPPPDAVHLGSTEHITLTKDFQVPHLIISTKMRYCIVNGLLSKIVLYFTDICPLYSPCNSKTLYIMFTDNRQESLEPKVRDEISFLLGEKKSIFKLV